VTVVDPREQRIVAVVDLPAADHPVGVCVSPDGRTVFVATGHGNSVVFIDAASLKVTSTVPAGERPWGLAVTPDGRKIYTVNGLSNDITVIDVTRRAAVATIPAGKGTWGVAVASAGAGS
jgi:YVTN family beta-propeller protein